MNTGEPGTTVVHGDADSCLGDLATGCVDCCVTSPPYYRMVHYGHPEELGWETSAALYVARLVKYFDHVRRVLSPTGTCWIVLGDTYLKRELVGIPSRVALAMVAAGWHWRADIIWAKPSSRESVKTRPRNLHEHILFFSKGRRWLYGDAGRDYAYNVWHFAPAPSTFVPRIFPPALAAGAVRLGSPAGGFVIDPFCGTGTTLEVAKALGRSAWGCDINADTVAAARRRLR